MIQNIKTASGVIILTIVIITAGIFVWQYEKGQSIVPSEQKTAAIIDINNKMDQKNDNMEPREFSCPGMDGFTFKYPVFKGWEFQGIKKEESTGICQIFLDDAELSKRGINTEITPQIRILKQANEENPSIISDKDRAKLNVNKVPYIYTPEKTVFEIDNYGFVAFFSKDHVIWISLGGGVSNENGFPVDDFFQTVIESFQVFN